MIGRIIELENIAEAERVLGQIGVEAAGITLMAPKALHRAIKLYAIRNVAANILKQEMLSIGGEVATAYGSINHSVETTDVLVMGTMKQLTTLALKLKQHQFGLPQLAANLEQLLQNYQAKSLPKTKIMGILNVTPDSFSDGGKFVDIEQAISRAKQMVDDGAEIIDIGGESTRPGAAAVSAREEKQRVLPVIERLVKEINIPISIDTTKAEVAAEAIACGASMVNDISGLRFDSQMAKVVAEAGVSLSIMHIQGNPQTMQQKPTYSDLMEEVINYLAEGLEIAQKAGILQGKIIVDPGLGFGKSPQHNLEIIKRLKELKVLGCPILIGPSRKSLIGQVLDLPVEERLEGTAAIVAASILNGANIVRVHDVKAMGRVVKMVEAILKGE
ncbi:MAG: dihydropteroate synthase [bacterium]